MNYVKSLKFEEEPKYNYLRNLLKNMIKKYNDPQFSWVDKSLIKNRRIYSINNIKIKKTSPFSNIISKLKANSIVAEKVNNIQIINASKFNAIENKNIYEQLKIDPMKSENQNYIKNIKS